MGTRIAACLWAAVACAHLCAQSPPAPPPDLSPAQSATWERVTTKVLAPCCWRETARTHQSPEGDRVRMEVAAMAREGLADEAILDRLIAEYSGRILREPRGATGVVAVAVPYAAALAAALGLLIFLRRRKPPAPLPAAGPLPEFRDIDDE